MRRLLAATLGTVAALTLIAGCDSGRGTGPTGAQGTAGVPGTATGVPPRQSTAPSASAEPSASVVPGPSVSAPAAPRKLKVGAKGGDVLAVQRRLTELGYWNGGADGTFGDSTQQAVYALQKAAGIGRDGTVGPKTLKALDAGVRPAARSTKGRVVEIDLNRQLLLLVDGGRITQIFNTSTGSNRYYEQKGGRFLADTPRGRFTVGREIDGWRNAPLGLLWRPKYFNGGIAVHGANSVPPYAASHGCARVSIAAMNWMWNNDALPLKTKVWVY
ncbi:peptidoglycan-binding protein [Actinoplanes sp. SE50]|uniref:L,D-transpeptidase family protein n=1 Tax=unclassified Actinoplanes TaxID=2626549 RepID=UPI00023EC002|nr:MULTISPECIES: L,D-transpeptidase family protein [unclassified Actinoplanes]AEV81287.1 Spore cortex-lytic enzyme [Actinoplanes sp. SE50/110]ATO79690.1 peptidoglycan-binding protein [Actinoplanes sp. SE50]SLL97093.1 peptidoglycan-binding protein [Actinoplanes sp. SE50/110]